MTRKYIKLRIAALLRYRSPKKRKFQKKILLIEALANALDERKSKITVIKDVNDSLQTYKNVSNFPPNIHFRENFLRIQISLF